MPDPTQALVSDASLASTLGIPVASVRAFRRPEDEGRLWARKTSSSAPAWTPEGVAAIRNRLLPGLEHAPAPAPSVEKKRGPQSFVVAKASIPNRRILPAVRDIATRFDRTTWVLVRVRDNVNFLPGMEIRAEPIEGSAEWRYLGRSDAPENQIRYPRGRGIW